jgi:hypothetical protein
MPAALTLPVVKVYVWTVRMLGVVKVATPLLLVVAVTVAL